MTTNHRNADDGERIDLTIDTDDDTIREATDVALPEEPVAIDVALEAATLERIDLERDGDEETIGAWIRDAVEWWLEVSAFAGRIPDIPEGADVEDVVQRPADYTPEHDTPDEELLAEASAADPDEPIAATVEFTAGGLREIDEWADVNIAPFVRRAVRMRLSWIDHELEATPTVTTDVPREVAERAQLEARRRAAHSPDGDYEEELEKALLNYVQPQTEFTVDGEPIARLGDEDDRQ